MQPSPTFVKITEKGTVQRRFAVDVFKVQKSEHTRNVFIEGELMENSVVRKFRTTVGDGKIYDVNYYNLDVIDNLGRVPGQVETKR